MNRRLSLYTSLVMLLMTAGSAFAVGAFFASDSDKEDVFAPGARAFVIRNGIHEDLILQVGFAGNASKFAWVVPVPSKPTIQYGNAGIFDELRDILNPYLFTKDASAAEKLQKKNEPKPILPDEFAIIPPTDKDALTRWLQASGYRITPQSTKLISDYVDKGWFFVIAKINAAPAPGARWLAPVMLSFDAQKAVLPANLTSLNSKPIILQLYVASSVLVSVPGLTESHTSDSPARSKFKMNEFPLFYQFVTRESKLTELNGLLDPSLLQSDIIISPKPVVKR
jgi:hypothetical protein